MRSVNKVILMGRLGAHPVRRSTEKGGSGVHFPLATSYWVSKKVDKGDGASEAEEVTCWHQISVWGREAETCAEYLKKGDPVYLDGMIVTKGYRDLNGVQKYSTEIRASQVNFIGRSDVSSRARVEKIADAVS